MLKKILIISYFLSYITLFAQHDEAKELMKDAECMSCHNNEDFVAKKGKVESFEKLSQTIDACRFGNDADWFDDESLDVAKYLNHKFYKFNKPLY